MFKLNMNSRKECVFTSIVVKGVIIINIEYIHSSMFKLNMNSRKECVFTSIVVYGEIIHPTTAKLPLK